MKTKSPGFNRNRIAIIVIHGIGEQVPFETLDAFATNFLKHLGEVKLRHEIVTRKGTSGVEWQESFVRIDRSNENPIDVHEYYWAYMTEDKIPISDVINWAEKTLEQTGKFYKQNEQLMEKYKERRGNKSFPMSAVLRWLHVAAIIFPLLDFLSAVFMPLSQQWIAGPLQKLKKKFGWIVTGYIGDVAIYTTMDHKSKYYAIRQEILNESQTLVEEILNDNRYDRVILAGHSLGSVIAYDTLNRINIKVNMRGEDAVPIDKLAGLITFGSPLDKIAFFFREPTKKDQYIRRQILAHLHSFKSKPLDTQKDAMKLHDPIHPKLDFIPWVNYWARNDPISGHLDFYALDENVELRIDEPWGVAHTGYWSSEKFYADIVDRFVKPYPPR